MVCEGEFVLSPVVSVFFSVHYPQLASPNSLKDTFLISSSHIRLGLHIVLPQVSPLKPCMHLCSAPHVTDEPLIHLILIDFVPSRTEL